MRLSRILRDTAVPREGNKPTAFPHGKCRGTDRGEEDSLGLGTVILLPAPRAQVKAHIEQEATSEQQRTAEHQIQEIHRLVFQVKGWDLVGF